MVTCRAEKTVGGCQNKGSLQSKSISTEGKTPISRNWKKSYLHRKGNIQRKENHQHRCHSWNCICEWLPPESGGRNREAHQETSESTERNRASITPLSYSGYWTDGAKIKNKANKIHRTLKQNKTRSLLLGKNWEFAHLKRFLLQNKTAHN